MSGLPGNPGPSLAAIFDSMSLGEQLALVPHLLGETSADWLAGVLRKYGHEVSATTIRTYRRALRQEASV
ncbi:hypothetical protein AB0D08_00305 [Kitasatospora sp. NPDC048540]|uniref:hypothetical protein n=1 Tax=Kitasatospora sp. NPDC048540 TaxID=3155634 RepID=UPI00340E59F2